MQYLNSDVVIIGAGAAGVFAAIQIAQNPAFNGKITIFDNGKKLGRKIKISGGGFCNFTNLNLSHNNYICNNPHFVKSALNGFTNHDFIEFLAGEISYYEKELGQLFTCDGANEIIKLLHKKTQKLNIEFKFEHQVEYISKDNHGFNIFGKFPKNIENRWQQTAKHLIIATGSPAYPALGATNFALKVANFFNLKANLFQPSLVGFNLGSDDKMSELSGLSLDVEISVIKNLTSTKKTIKSPSFKHKLLITHQGISGPAVLQISNYWHSGDKLLINFLPDLDLAKQLKSQKNTNGKVKLSNFLSEFMPRKLIIHLLAKIENTQNKNSAINLADITLAEMNNNLIELVVQNLQQKQLLPPNTAGFGKAEIARGGIDVSEVSSKTMQVKQVENLYVIGEALDVAGQLGGYNFQWAWSSAFACANAILDQYS